MQEQVENEGSKTYRNESDGNEVHAERRADNETDDCPGQRGVDVSKYCHDELRVVSVQL